MHRRNRYPLVRFVGEIDNRRKAQARGDARAVLFAIDRREPFGLVMIEAMACGTPVVACRRGAVPEVREDGPTGFIVEGIDEAVAAVRALDRLDCRRIRPRFERRFAAERIARAAASSVDLPGRWRWSRSR